MRGVGWGLELDQEDSWEKGGVGWGPELDQEDSWGPELDQEDSWSSELGHQGGAIGSMEWKY